MTRRASVLTWKNSRDRPRMSSRERVHLFRAVAVLMTVGMALWLFVAWTSLLSLVVPADFTIDGKPMECLAYRSNPNQRFIIFGDPSGQGVVSLANFENDSSAVVVKDCSCLDILSHDSYREISCQDY